MKPSLAARQMGIVVLLALASIAFHEFGHFVVYWLGRCPVRISFQSVRPIGEVSGPLNLLALAAGPAFTLLAAGGCLLVARRRPTFFWVTAAFTNAAAVRLFPLAMDILHAVQGAMPFSDEGNLVLAVTQHPAARAALLLVVFAVFLGFTVAAARLYTFERYRKLKIAGVYFLGLSSGIVLVLIDELLLK